MKAALINCSSSRATTQLELSVLEMAAEPKRPNASERRLRVGSLLALIYVFMLCVFAPAPAVAQSVEWTQRFVSGPSNRVVHAMAYDTLRGVTVFFGGASGSVYQGDTWEWNGTAWTQRLVSGPSPRWAHGMVYDSARGVTVLFGGSNNGVYNGETWEWNGTAWTQRIGGGPSPRGIGAGMVYDSARHVVVLFGGDTGGVSNGETWEWNGTSWTQRMVSGPSPRVGHAMAYDSARGVTVLFGGNDGVGNHLGDSWEWNGTAWTQRIVSGPSSRYGHMMVYDTARGATTLFGGIISDSPFVTSGETWEWNGNGGGTWTQRPVVSGPSPRVGHAMAYDAARGVAVLFGGSNNSHVPNSETWEMCATLPISAQPVDRAVLPGEPVTFFVEAPAASGCMTPLAYQWQRRDPAVSDPSAPNAWIDLADAGGFINTHTSALVISHPTPALATGYRCRISGGCACSPTSTQTVNFLIHCTADLTHDGQVTSQDFFYFLAAFFAGC